MSSSPWSEDVSLDATLEAEEKEIENLVSTFFAKKSTF